MLWWKSFVINDCLNWVSSLETPCQAFSSYLFVVFLNFVFSCWETCSVELKSLDWLGLWTECNLSAFIKSWVAFSIYWGHYPAEQWMSVFSVWLNVSRQCSPVHVTIHLPTPVNSHITNTHQCFTGICTCSCHNTDSIVFDPWCSV